MEEPQKISQEALDVLINSIKGVEQHLLKIKSAPDSKNEKTLPSHIDIGNLVTMITLDPQSGNVTLDIPTEPIGEWFYRKVKVLQGLSDVSQETQEGCSHEEKKVMKNTDVNKQKVLQKRIDDLLSGNFDENLKNRKEKEGNIFAPFLSEDKVRASALAALCTKIAKEENENVLKGLELAIDELYGSLKDSPPGLVQNAAKLFLTHFQPARELLQIRSLEERQPQMVTPSYQKTPKPA